MSVAAEARQSELDRVLESEHPSLAVADEIFAVVDALSASPQLRRALTDPGSVPDARAQVVQALFSGKVGTAPLNLLEQAARLRWSTAGAFAAAIERQGVRAALLSAQRDGSFDGVEDELFKLGRLVDGNPELRAALGDRQVPLVARQKLLIDVIGGRVLDTVSLLAKRAVLARQRTFDLTLAEDLRIAADLRNRAIATVEVARPMTREQSDRLRAALTRQVGREVSLHVIVSPEVIGGVRVTLGDEVIEGTMAGRLEDARRKLSQ